MRNCGLALFWFTVVGFLFGVAVGFQLGFEFGAYHAQETEVITEQHYITEVADGFVRTEQVRGKGEGTIYPTQLYVLHGITPKVGKRVDFGWTAQDYEDEVWERVHELTEVEAE